jgi:hypothetical protein
VSDYTKDIFTKVAVLVAPLDLNILYTNVDMLPDFEIS